MTNSGNQHIVNILVMHRKRIGENIEIVNGLGCHKDWLIAASQRRAGQCWICRANESMSVRQDHPAETWGTVPFRRNVLREHEWNDDEVRLCIHNVPNDLRRRMRVSD